MNARSIALSTGCFYRRRIFDVLAAVRDAGFAEIEVCSSPQHLDYHDTGQTLRAAAEMHRLGLVAVSLHAPFAAHIDITSPDEAVREASVQDLFRACEAAAQMNARHVVLHPGPEREGRPHEEEFLSRMHHAAVSLNRVARRCCELGVHLLLENMLAHLMFGHVRDMLYLLGEIKTCEVGACLDTGHAHLARELDMVIQKLSGHLCMVHVNDNNGDWDAHLAPGEGGIDWPWFMRELHRRHFHGPLVLEMSGSTDEPVAVVLERAVRARDYLWLLESQIKAEAREQPPSDF
ncbi:sugar phosphate isomerase/epimerase family protein [Prosthecobacter sp.]|uniref:sugar phosphate isomerase/epimerase family protein n=1 Tax=Prosthecobacter sp. TaxID=1965333 RepID=UPI003782ECB1